MTHYVFSKGSNDAICIEGESQAGQAALHGDPPTFGDIPSNQRGMFNLNQSTRIRDLFDGTSNTFAMGEGAGGAQHELCNCLGCSGGTGAYADVGWMIGEPANLILHDPIPRPKPPDDGIGSGILASTVERLNKNPVTATYLHAEGTGDGFAGLVDCRSSLDGGHDTASNFRSAHTGGGFFLLADDSVQFLNEYVDAITYRALSTIAGGEAVVIQK